MCLETSVSSSSSLSRRSRVSTPSRSPSPSPGRGPGFAVESGGASPAVSSRRSVVVAAVGETPSRARFSISVLCGAERGYRIASVCQEREHDEGASASRGAFFSLSPSRVKVDAGKSREKGAHRVASGTHHALVGARLPRDIGHPRTRAGLVYVRERLEAGPRASSRLPRARTRPARRFPGGSATGKQARPRVGTRETNACNRRRARSTRARRAAEARACQTVRSTGASVAHHVRACRALVSSSL